MIRKKHCPDGADSVRQCFLSGISLRLAAGIFWYLIIEAGLIITAGIQMGRLLLGRKRIVDLSGEIHVEIGQRTVDIRHDP